LKYENNGSIPILSEQEAGKIAESVCIKDGESLSRGYYNENSGTWWFDANLNSAPYGCSPACVVSEETRTAEINWRCTGLSPDNDEEILCRDWQRNAETCTTEYAPVCATVNIQCVRAPCEPIQQTFGNQCEACRNSLVSSYVNGACKTDTGMPPYDSGVRGQVLLGPTCPVMREPPDPDCADKPYETTILVISMNDTDVIKSSPFATTKSYEDGKYVIALPPGKYALQPIGGRVMPSCETKEITVPPLKFIDIILTCDTGIR